MCGISGIFNRDLSPIPIDILNKMNDKIVHRGPDDHGFSFCGLQPKSNDISKAFVGLAFRRLSILDLSDKGHQPMSDKSGNYTIVFNGEIFNYLEIKAELINKGYSFYSNTDTEVALYAFIEYGFECFNKFNGMWALAIWDNKHKSLTLCRDRWGIKPLCYLRVNQSIFFGSEEKQLLDIGFDISPNFEQIYRYLKLGAMVRYDNNTFYKEIKVVPPAHYIQITPDMVKVKRYYHMNINNFEQYTGSFEDAIREYSYLFDKSIEYRMQADVPVGACLSGGLDSSAIVCAATKFSQNNINTFSAYYDNGKAYDERKYIKLVNQFTCSKEHLVNPNPEEILNDFLSITYSQDAPVISSSVISQYYVMKEAKKHNIKVLLDGQGSDELTAGYNHAYYRYFADMLRDRNFTDFSAELPQYLNSNRPGSKIAKLSKIGLSFMFSEKFLYQNEIKYLVPDVLKVGINNNLENVKNLKCSKLSNFQYNLLCNIFLPSLLHFEDRNSMAHGVESRVPFLDVNLVEFAYSLPAKFKINGTMTKLVHRKAMKKFAPKEIYRRNDKVCFAAPGETVWLRKYFNGSLRRTLNSPFFTESEYFNTPVIGEIVHNYLNGDNKNASLIWKLWALGNWYKLNFDKNRLHD